MAKNKEKFALDEVVEGFQSSKFTEIVENLSKRKIYEQKRLDLDDGISEYSGFNPGYIFSSEVEFDN